MPTNSMMAKTGVATVCMQIIVLLIMSILGGCHDAVADIPAKTPTRSIVPDRTCQTQGFGLAVCGDANYALVTSAVENKSVSTVVRVFDLSKGTRVARLVLPKTLNVEMPMHVSTEGKWATIGFLANRSQDKAVFGYKITDPNRVVRMAPKDGADELLFSWSVAMDANQVIVGASGTDDSIGSAYLFDLKTGREVRQFTAPRTVKGTSLFGAAVAMSRKYVVIAASAATIEDKVEAGAIYIYARTTGKYLGRVVSPRPSEHAVFGSAVAISGHQVVVGAPRSPDGDGKGYAYVFDLNTKRLLGNLTVAREDRKDWFGASIDVGNGIIVVGAPGTSWKEKNGPVGAAYVFDVKSRKPLMKLQRDGSTPHTLFGRSVAVAGQRILVGEPFAPGEKGNDRKPGAVHVFKLPSKDRGSE